MISTTLQEAIKRRKVVEFSYDGKRRVVEPFLIGMKTTGNLCLVGWQRSGGSNTGDLPGWRHFLTTKIVGMKLTRDDFEGDREGYNPRDKTMTQVLLHV